jgi:hypothetical protein
LTAILAPASSRIARPQAGGPQIPLFPDEGSIGWSTTLSMIYLLGGSGYVGHAYQALFRLKGVAYRSLSRSEVDYTDAAALR